MCPGSLKWLLSELLLLLMSTKSAYTSKTGLMPLFAMFKECGLSKSCMLPPLAALQT
jgi:hypothetical protein